MEETVTTENMQFIFVLIIAHMYFIFLYKGSIVNKITSGKGRPGRNNNNNMIL